MTLSTFPEIAFEEPEKKCETCGHFNLYGVCMRDGFKFGIAKDDCYDYWKTFADIQKERKERGVK